MPPKRTKKGTAATVNDKDTSEKPEKRLRKVKEPIEEEVNNSEEKISQVAKETSEKPVKRAPKVKEDPIEEEVKNSEVKMPRVAKESSDKPVRKARKLKEPVEEQVSSDDGEPTEKKPVPSKKAALNKKKPKSSKEPSDDDEEEKPKRKSARAKKDTKSEAPAPLLNKASTSWESIDFSCTKKNKQGQQYNLKITSWNVDGIRAWLKKDGLTILKYDEPDVFCLQETKCSDDKLPEEVKNVKGYKTYWCPSEKDGYAGVSLFSKVEPISIKYGIGEPEHDDEGRCITAEYEKFFVVSVYVPNAGRGLVTLPKRLKWNEAFKDYIKALDEKKPVIICGDMNVAHSEIDLANPKTNTKNAGFTKEEREGMTEFLGNGYVDTFRKLYPEQKDAYTFWSYITKARAKNVGWRLDYFIVSERIMDSVCDSVLRSEAFGSDHCPVTLFINI